MNTTREKPWPALIFLWLIAIAAAFAGGWLVGADETPEADITIKNLTNELEEFRSAVAQVESERDQAVGELTNVQEVLDDTEERNNERVEELARYPGVAAASSYSLVRSSIWTATLTLMVVDVPASSDPLTWLLLTIEDAEPNLQIGVQLGSCKEQEEVSLGSMSDVVVGSAGRLTHVQPNLSLPLDDSSLWIRLSTELVPDGPGVRSFASGGQLVDGGQTFRAGELPCES